MDKTKKSLKIMSYLCLASLSIIPLSVLAQSNEDKVNLPVIEDASGLKNVQLSGVEAYFDFNKKSGAKGQLSTDGPTLTIQAEISKNLVPLALNEIGTVTASTTLMTNELALLDQSKIKIPIIHGEVDWGHFFREAKIVLDIDPQSGSPFATIVKSATVGIQDIESEAFNSKMPILDNWALRGITRQRSARAIRLDLTPKILDSLALALFETGVYHPENFGDNPQPNSSGATVLMTKSFSERLKVSGSLTRINFPKGAEIRINSGIAYENKEKGFTIFYNRVDFKNNPLYPEATSASTLGVVKQITPRHAVTAETTNVNDGRSREYAVGYTYAATKRTTVGVGVRKTQEGTKFEARAAYNFSK